MLGHIVSKEGLAIDPDRFKAIEALPLPSNKKALQYFLGQINFVKKIISVFSHIISPITTMLKKYAITKAPTLKNLDFSKDFIMYAYGEEKIIATILA